MGTQEIRLGHLMDNCYRGRGCEFERLARSFLTANPNGAFRDRAARGGANPEPVRLLKGRLRDLEQRNQRLRAELREAKATTAMLEGQIAVETLEHRAWRAQDSPAPRLRAVPELNQSASEPASDPEG